MVEASLLPGDFLNGKIGLNTDLMVVISCCLGD